MTRKSKSWRQLLEYMMQDKSRAESFVLKQHIEGNTISAWARHFEVNEGNRKHHRTNNVKLYHEIISWSAKDIQKMTDAKMKDMAKKYLELRGENAMAIAIPHFNKTHYHVHFCISGVEIETGKAMRISKEDFTRVKQLLQEYQLAKYPELTNSAVEHGKNQKQQKDREFQLTKRTKQPSERGRTQMLLNECYKKSLSQKDFFDRISQSGLKLYERGGKIAGIEGERKMRLSTLGFDEAKLRDLEERTTRLTEIQNVRADDRYDRAKELDERLDTDEKLDKEESAPQKEGVEREDEIRIPEEDSPDVDIDL